MLMAEYVTAADAAFDRYMETADRYVCTHCDVEVANFAITCHECGDYSGIVTMQEWEQSTGEEWE